MASFDFLRKLKHVPINQLVKNLPTKLSKPTEQLIADATKNIYKNSMDVFSKDSRHMKKENAGPLSKLCSFHNQLKKYPTFKMESSPYNTNFYSQPFVVSKPKKPKKKIASHQGIDIGNFNPTKFLIPKSYGKSGASFRSSSSQSSLASNGPFHMRKQQKGTFNALQFRRTFHKGLNSAKEKEVGRRTYSQDTGYRAPWREDLIQLDPDTRDLVSLNPKKPQKVAYTLLPRNPDIDSNCEYNHLKPKLQKQYEDLAHLKYYHINFRVT